MRLFDGQGRPILLGREIGRGGEGAVLDVSGDGRLVAKLYHGPVDAEKIAKLTAMSRLGTDALLRVAAWPTATLHQTPGGPLVGFLQPKVTGHREIHQLYSFAERKTHFPRADFSFLIHVAMNCAAAFETIHAAGHIIGDVNQRGVFVSPQGMVRLIDCDSFQICDTDGRLFLCDVGVAEWTPPELQGRSFGGLVRTQQHDCFGLALLIFHLLFMGRHPFAGQFAGADDMPIEKAIAQGRFAFGRLAHAWQMEPPPFSLPLRALPALTRDMFERAFVQTPGYTRPTAGEWRIALEKLKHGLKLCPADPGHRYPPHLLRCPWCEIVEEGGPNFFISIRIASLGVLQELPPLDVQSLWSQIEAVAMPAVAKPIYPRLPAPLTPAPVPESILVRQTLKQGVGAAAIVCLALIIVASAFNGIALWITSVLAGIFAIWWAVLGLRSPLRREHLRRVRQMQIAKAKVYELQARWDLTESEARARFIETKANLRNVREQALSLRGRFEADRQKLVADQQAAQLDDYLSTKLLRDHAIPSIGRGRQATLASYGIETAADISEAKLSRIPGFAPPVVGELVHWRRQMAQGFVFNPNRHIPSQASQSLAMKYLQMQQSAEAALRRGLEEATTLAANTRQELVELSEKLRQRVAEARQAEADANFLK